MHDDLIARAQYVIARNRNRIRRHRAEAVAVVQPQPLVRLFVAKQPIAERLQGALAHRRHWQNRHFDVHAGQQRLRAEPDGHLLRGQARQGYAFHPPEPQHPSLVELEHEAAEKPRSIDVGHERASFGRVEVFRERRRNDDRVPALYSEDLLLLFHVLEHQRQVESAHRLLRAEVSWRHPLHQAARIDAQLPQ